MIVPMHKATILCLASDRKATLDALRALGCLHLQSVQPPEDSNVERARAAVDRCGDALRMLAPLAEQAPSQREPDMEPARLTEEVVTLKQTAAELDETIRHLRADITRVEPLGNLDPELLKRLAAKGIHVTLFALPRPDIESLLRDTETRAPSDDTIWIDISRNPPSPCTAAVGLSKPAIEAPTLPWPEQSLASLRNALDAKLDERRRLDDRLVALAAFHGALLTYHAQLVERLDFSRAAAGMGEADRIAYLRGFCPVERVPDLQTAAARHGWGLVVGEPDADEPVPTLIRLPRWARSIKPLFTFLGILPGYHETDVAPAFLVFLAIFFAMIVGDAGYGLLLLATVLWLGKRFPKAPREPFRLMTIFFSATIAWGLISANYFGIDPARLPAWLRALRISWLARQDNSMSFCLFLGALHLSLAHAWNAIRFSNSPKALAQVGWIGVTWTMFAAARMLLLDAAFPRMFLIILPLSAAAILMEVVMAKAWMRLPTLPQDFVSNFGDLMSYLRLFALGIASVKVAEAFNSMAGMIGYTSVITIAGAVLVLLLGHLLNIVLCGLSVLVHGVRLNTLEFSLHMGQEWSGFAYRPFGEKPQEP